MKLPVAHTLGNRNASLDKDPLMRNALAEPDEAAGVVRARKRPAIESAYSVESGTGQSMLTWTIADPDGDEEVLVVISDDIINTAPTPLTKALRFGVQPTAPYLNAAISPSVTVLVVDQAGNTVTGSSANVTVSLGTNPTDATLGGTLTQAASSGVATFNNLTLNRSGSGFALAAASSTLRGATSDAFTIPTQLTFTTQPAGAAPDATFSVTVASKDLNGTTDTRYTGFITLEIYSGSGGTLGGNLQRLAVSGAATFSDLTIDTEGTYTLKASAEADSGLDCYTPAARVSDSFPIADYIMVAAEITPTNFGYVTGSSGSLTPDTYLGNFITTINSDSGGPQTDIQIAGGPHPQGYFTSLTVGATTMLSASATFTANIGGGVSLWRWTDIPITSASTYAVTIV